MRQGQLVSFTIMSDELEHYAALGLPPGAPPAQVRARFRLLAKRLHPDLHGGDTRYHERFRRIHAAYEFLADPQREAAYDAWNQDRTLSASSPLDAPDTPGSLWIRVGASHSVPPAAADPVAPHRRHRVALGRVVRRRLAAALTWSLTATALFLFGALMHQPRADAGPGHTARQMFVTTATSQTDAVPPTANAASDGSPDAAPITAAPSSEPYHTWEPPSALHAAPDTLDPATDSRYTVAPKYLVDPKYTTIDPHETTVDPAMTAVDSQAVSIDTHITAIDPSYTSIDPRLTSP